jgi:hypothetical protein
MNLVKQIRALPIRSNPIPMRCTPIAQNVHSESPALCACGSDRTLQVLHNLTVTYNGGSVIERFGLRSWGVDAESARLTVNGKVQKLVGWNHHTQWPVTAASPTDGQIAADIKLLKAAVGLYPIVTTEKQLPNMIGNLV